MVAKMITPQAAEKFDPFFVRKQNKTAVNKDSIEGMTRETDRNVTGTFMNIECPGQPAKVCGKYYKGMPFFSQTFKDGEKYTIPLSVARAINERCYYEVHSHITDERGEPIKHPTPRYRYKFIIES